MATSPTEVVSEFLQNTAPDKIEEAAGQLVAEDATYVSLNFDNPELKRILPWAGTSPGRQPFIDTFTRVANYWTIEDFDVTDLFGDGDNVAVFGSFTYRDRAKHRGPVRAPLGPIGAAGQMSPRSTGREGCHTMSAGLAPSSGHPAWLMLSV